MTEGRISEAEFGATNDRAIELIQPSGLSITKTHLCPHSEDSECLCLKPKPDLLLSAVSEYNIDLSKSWMIGDRPSDVMTGINADTKSILVKTGAPAAESAKATATLPSLLEAVRFIASNDHTTALSL